MPRVRPRRKFDSSVGRDDASPYRSGRTRIPAARVRVYIFLISVRPALANDRRARYILCNTMCTITT